MLRGALSLVLSLCIQRKNNKIGKDCLYQCSKYKISNRSPTFLLDPLVWQQAHYQSYKSAYWGHGRLKTLIPDCFMPTIQELKHYFLEKG